MIRCPAMWPWALAVAFAAALGPSFHLDDNVDFTSDAQRQARAELRKQLAAQDVCGPGSYAVWLDDNTTSCRPRNGGKTRIVVSNK